MNSYSILKQAHQKEVNEFPLCYAFNNKQFEEGMAKLGLTPDQTDKVFGTGSGGFYLRTDDDRLNKMFDRHRKQIRDAIDKDTISEEFILDMFNYELANHEFIITGDESDAINALGLSWDDIEKNQKLRHGLELAKKRQYEEHGK